jgi:hypothetical protein
MGGLPLRILGTWSQSAPCLAPFQEGEGPLLALDDPPEYPPRVPGNGFVVKKEPRKKQPASDIYLAGSRLFGTERAQPLRCPRNR